MHKVWEALLCATMLFTAIGQPYNLLARLLCIDIKLCVILPQMQSRVYLLFSEPTAWINLWQAPCLCSPPLAHTHTYPTPYYFVYNLTFSILYSFIIKSKGLQPKSAMLPSYHKPERVFSHQRQQLDLWGVPQYWHFMQDKGKAKENLNYVPGDARVPDPIHSSGQWHWGPALCQAL